MGDCMSKLLQADKQNAGDRVSIRIINAENRDAESRTDRRIELENDQISDQAGAGKHKRNTSINPPSETIETNALTVPPPRQGVLKTISRFITGSDNKSQCSLEDLGLALTSKRGVRFSNDNLSMVNLKSGFSMNRMDPLVEQVIEGLPELDPTKIPELSDIYDPSIQIQGPLTHPRNQQTYMGQVRNEVADGWGRLVTK